MNEDIFDHPKCVFDDVEFGDTVTLRHKEHGTTVTGEVTFVNGDRERMGVLGVYGTFLSVNWDAIKIVRAMPDEPTSDGMVVVKINGNTYAKTGVLWSSVRGNCHRWGELMQSASNYGSKRVTVEVVYREDES